LVDGGERVSQVLSRRGDAILRRHPAGEALRHPRAVVGAGTRKIFQRAQCGVDGNLNLQPPMIGGQFLPPPMQIQQGEETVGAEHAQEDRVCEKYLGRYADPHGCFRWWIR
jgi:hypothetical protein